MGGFYVDDDYYNRLASSQFGQKAQADFEQVAQSVQPPSPPKQVGMGDLRATEAAQPEEPSFTQKAMAAWDQMTALPDRQEPQQQPQQQEPDFTQRMKSAFDQLASQYTANEDTGVPAEANADFSTRMKGAWDAMVGGLGNLASQVGQAAGNALDAAAKASDVLTAKPVRDAAANYIERQPALLKDVVAPPEGEQRQEAWNKTILGQLYPLMPSQEERAKRRTDITEQLQANPDQLEQIRQFYQQQGQPMPSVDELAAMYEKKNLAGEMAGAAIGLATPFEHGAGDLGKAAAKGSGGASTGGGFGSGLGATGGAVFCGASSVELKC